MDNIIVNSALWYAEQSSQFLLNSGANKLLDKGYDYYVKEFIPLGHRLIQNGQIAADAVNNPALTSPLVIDGACRATRKPG